LTNFRHQHGNCLVSGLEHEFYDFPCIGNNHPNCYSLIFFRGVAQPPTICSFAQPMLTRRTPSMLGGSLGREFRRLHFCGLHWGRSHGCHGMLVVSVKPQAPNHRLNIWVWPEKQRTPKWIRMVPSKGTIIEYHWIMYHISGNTKSTSPGHDHRWWLVINYYKRPQNISQKHI